MGVVGFQDFWVAGSRLYFERDPKGATYFPLLDLGLIQPANPALNLEKIELFDSECGINQLADEKVTKIDESYDITCSNFNTDNLSLLFLGNPPAAFTQSQVDVKAVNHKAFSGRLMKVVDTASTNLYSLAGVTFYTGTDPSEYAVDEVDVDDGTGKTKLYLTGDQTAVGITAGDKVYFGVKNLTVANFDKVNRYTVNAIGAFAGGRTPVTLNEKMPGADIATGLAGAMFHADATTWYTLNTDYQIVSLDRGLARVVAGGAITDMSTIKALYSLKPLSGNRLVTPQSLEGEALGNALLYWCRGNGAQETVRRARVSLTPSQANIQIDDYSNFVVTMKVISDLTSLTPAGDLVYFKGDIPSLS